jgi:chromosome segregation ATPase
MIEKTARFAAIAMAALFVCVSFGGIFGAWFVSRAASDVALKMFGVFEIGVGVIDAGVGRVDDLVAKSRTEVQQASETIKTVGGQALANSPVLAALNERLDTSLAPRIAQMRQALAPVRDAVEKVSNAIEVVSSLPGMNERAPRLAELNEALDRLEGLSADATQLRSTLRGLVEATAGEVAPETVAALNGLTQRIDTRLGEVQTKIQTTQGEVDALKARIEKKKSRLLFVFNLVAMLVTFAFGWILYAQVVVIQHHRALIRRAAAAGVTPQ